MPTTESPVSEWYNGKSIFITGATGFMGKVLLEKLLYACRGIKNVYILTRAKKGKSAEERLQTMWKLPMFKRLRETDSTSFKKVVPLVGDLYTDGLGLSQTDLNLLINNANVVFHCAATLKLEAPLKDAIEQNTTGTARVIDVVKQIKDLKVFVHFSTAYCSADIDVFEEKVYDCRDDPRQVIEVTKWMNNDALVLATPKIIAPHPNTYTYSKRLSEKLVADEAANIPVCIVRPSIVCPSLSEPLPGWVDSLNGPMGLLVGAGKGVIRSMHGKPDNRTQMIPVDIAINATIIIAQKLGSCDQRPKEVPVYNLTQNEARPITMGYLLENGRQIVRENPFEGQVWYPDGDLRPSKFIHKIYTFFFHWIPAYFIDFLMLILLQKRFMVRLQGRISDGLDLLEFFTVREFIFKNDKFLNLANEVTETDRKMFSTDLLSTSVTDYMKICILGARQYLMKEDLSTIPRCRIQQNILYVVHILCVYGFYFYILWSIASIPYVKSMLSSVGLTFS